MTIEIEAGEMRYLSDPRREEKRVYDMYAKNRLILEMWTAERNFVLKTAYTKGFIVGAMAIAFLCVLIQMFEWMCS